MGETKGVVSSKAEMIFLQLEYTTGICLWKVSLNYYRPVLQTYDLEVPQFSVLVDCV